VTEPSERIAELERRIARLEEALRARNSREQTIAAEAMLAAEPSSPKTAETAIPKNRTVLPTPRSVPVVPAQMPAFADVSIARPPKRDWEALVGRYGMLVLGTVTALTGVGTFIGWAIAHGLLGPTQRVSLGLISAGALAVWGLRLRKRERSFGATIIGVSLAMVQVCAWGAGPSLHLVPTSVAFALAAVASLALETFAHRENDEALWSVGFFGAALAPFVTSDGSGNLPMLTLYGIGVMVSGGYALGNRPWRIAGRLFGLSALLYVGSLMLGAEAKYGPLLALLFPIAVSFLGVLRWSDGWKRRLRLRLLGLLAGIAAIRVGVGIGMGLSPVLLAELIGLAGVAWLTLVGLTHKVESNEDAPHEIRIADGDRFDAGIAPMMFAMAAVMPLEPWRLGAGIALGLGALALLVSHIRLPANGLRDGAAMATVACAAVGAALATADSPAVMLGAISVVGAAAFAADHWRPSGWWTAWGLVPLAWAMTVGMSLLNDRIAYEYAPFLTSASASAAVIFGSAAAAWRLARDPERRVVISGMTVVWGFAWVHQEIAGAVSKTVSTLLRVSYYAATSVAAVWFGRARRVPILRHVGLGLAVVAAGTALYTASSLASVGARVFADLVSAGFLMGIAYWYRKPGASPEITEQQPPASLSDR